MLIDRRQSGLLVVDVQERLAPVVAGRDAIARNIAILLRAAHSLAVPVLLSEQYPKGLGHTIAPLSELAPADAARAKIAFSCLAEAAPRAALESWGREQILVCGMEAHVCVLQSALDLCAAGYRTIVVADAVGSRVPANAALALERMARAGAEVVTTEMVVFEWLRRADDPHFRELLALIK